MSQQSYTPPKPESVPELMKQIEDLRQQINVLALRVLHLCSHDASSFIRQIMFTPAPADPEFKVRGVSDD